MDTMDCTQARNLLSEHQDRTLDTAPAAALGAHLRGCGECAGADASLLAVRGLLRGLPPDPAPPELLARVLAAVESEDRDARPISAPGGADAARPFLSRFRVPLEAAAVVLLFASVYWYQQTSPPTARPPAAPSVQAPVTTPPVDVSPEAGKASPSRPMAAKRDVAKGPPPAIRPPGGNPETAMEAGPSLPKPRPWAADGLPSAPAYFASTDSERIVPAAPFPRLTADLEGPGAPASGGRRSAEAGGGANFRLSRSFAAPPSRLLRPLPYERDLVVNVKPESREGAEERIAEWALRLGGIVERVERNPAGADPGEGRVRAILPVPVATRFLEEMDRIGTIPPEGKPDAADFPAGARAGSIAYTVRVR